MIKIIPLSLLIISILLTYILRNFLTFQFPKFIGLFLIIVSILIIFSGLFTLILNGTTIIPGNKPTKLVKTGIFKFLRNPIYFGDIILIFGISIYFQTLIGFLFGILFFIIVNSFVVPVEEKILEEHFQNEYLEYKNRVKRWGIF